MKVTEKKIFGDKLTVTTSTGKVVGIFTVKKVSDGVLTVETNDTSFRIPLFEKGKRISLNEYRSALLQEIETRYGTLGKFAVSPEGLKLPARYRKNLHAYMTNKNRATMPVLTLIARALGLPKRRASTAFSRAFFIDLTR